jgi:hypothetical protein
MVQGGLKTLNHDLSQRPVQKFRVVYVGTADGDRLRESTPVDQQTALAPFFPVGWVPVYAFGC